MLDFVQEQVLCEDNGAASQAYVLLHCHPVWTNKYYYYGAHDIWHVKSLAGHWLLIASLRWYLRLWTE